MQGGVTVGDWGLCYCVHVCDVFQVLMNSLSLLLLHKSSRPLSSERLLHFLVDFSVFVCVCVCVRACVRACVCVPD